MAATVDKLGPGTVTVGAVGSEVDFSCQVTAAVVEWESDQDDDTIVLCGDTVAGAITFSATFSGTVFQDTSDDAGLVAFTWAHKGESVPLVFVPSTAGGKQVTGTVTIVPLSIGGDEAGSNMTSDFEWAFVGEPVLGDFTPVTTTATKTAASTSSSAA